MRARVLEKLINAHLLKYLQGNSLLCHHQAGFLPFQSTITQLCLLTHKWQTALDRGDKVEAVSLDLSKANDRVSVPGLIYKRSQTGFSQAALTWQKVIVLPDYYSLPMSSNEWKLFVLGNSYIWNPSGSGIGTDPKFHCRRIPLASQWRSWCGCLCGVWRRKGVRGLCPRENFFIFLPETMGFCKISCARKKKKTEKPLPDERRKTIFKKSCVW